MLLQVGYSKDYIINIDMSKFLALKYPIYHNYRCLKSWTGGIKYPGFTYYPR